MLKLESFILDTLHRYTLYNFYRIMNCGDLHLRELAYHLRKFFPSFAQKNAFICAKILPFICAKNLPFLNNSKSYSRHCVCYLWFAHAKVKLPCRSDLDKTDKYATINFDKKYEKCLQDIHKKYILGTYK